MLAISGSRIYLAAFAGFLWISARAADTCKKKTRKKKERGSGVWWGGRKERESGSRGGGKV
jgi:hypothetical protein